MATFPTIGLHDQSWPAIATHCAKSEGSLVRTLTCGEVWSRNVLHELLHCDVWLVYEGVQP